MTAANAAQRIMEMVVSERRTIGRVKLPLHRSAADSVSAPPAVKRPKPGTDPAPPEATPAVPEAAADGSELPDNALQVLTLAQRTAENHITAANQHAEEVRSEARATAEQIRRDADSYCDSARAEMDGLLAEARAAAELCGREADAQAAEIRRQAESRLADAQIEAERIVAEGLDRAEQLDLRARQRYEDSVGSLSIKREALQRQIEALAVFDADYRHRLASFMQTQLRSLWIEPPGPRDVPIIEAQMPGGPVGSSDPK